VANSKRELPDFLVTWKSAKKSIIEGKYINELTKREGTVNLRWNQYSEKFEEPLDFQPLPPKRVGRRKQGRIPDPVTS
jgi:hypothetical protein